ncbi:MAG: hypothetical protein DME19_13805 [Verrucomicrobia bacterium]|nr:MAG: hypothetical protein DME19_13805 [Verrucomicrobiota bacterium]
MSQTNFDSKVTACRRSRRSAVDRQNHKIVVSEVPNFLVRLVGWRRLKAALTETLPRYRHD